MSQIVIFVFDSAPVIFNLNALIQTISKTDKYKCKNLS